MNFSLTLVIVAVTVIVSVIGFNNRSFRNKLAFHPYLIKHNREYYRFITHAFIHANWMHLLFNMWMIFHFGQFVEDEFASVFPANGKISYLLLYFGGVIFSSLYSHFKHKDNSRYGALGASGGVSSIFFAEIIMSPTSELHLYFMLPMPAFVLGILYLWYEYSMSKRNKKRSKIGHDAHFYGALFGIIFMVIIDYNFLITCLDKIKVYLSGILG